MKPWGAQVAETYYLPLAFGEEIARGLRKENRSERLRDKAVKSKSQPLFAELI